MATGQLLLCVTGESSGAGAMRWTFITASLRGGRRLTPATLSGGGTRLVDAAVYSLIDCG
jgi:hypothetical protein